tara:strand:+ start:481 stop:1005 length:525 start_codon:yes stop_codon:yes gene_type:complete
MSTLKVSTISPLGTDSTKTITIGSHSNGDTAAGIFTNLPVFSAELSSAQTLANNTNVTIVCDSELIDTDSGYDTSTGKYTIPTGKGGVYYFHCYLRLDTGTDATRLSPALQVNGTTVATTNTRQNEEDSCYVTKIHTCSAGDVISWFVFQSTGGNANTKSGSHTGFMGYRLIGA